MPEFDDLRLERTPASPPPSSRPPWGYALIGLLLVLALLAVWYYPRWRARPEDAVGVRDATEPVTAPPPTSSAPSAVPALDDSDAYVRDLVRALSQHPIVAAWLTTDQLIRTFAVSVMNVANGETPAPHLSTIKPDVRFGVVRRGAGSRIDPRSYARFDGHAAAFAELDPDGCARLYATLKPRIEEAYREFAGPNASLDRAIERAIAELLRTPVVQGDVALVRGTVGYDYADPSLASLSRAQQQLLRTGPQNVQMIQNQLRAIASRLGISESALPKARVIRSGR